MDTNWIILLLLGINMFSQPTNCQSNVEAELVMRKYVEKGSSVTMVCRHNVPSKILYKVTWRKINEGKIFEYINGRNPPFRNFTVRGAEIDWAESNAEQLTLKKLDFDASGSYCCEVSTDTPIFTKPSPDEQLHVILPQVAPPRILFSKRHFYIGEKLVANCTTSKARPAPHITWLINGKKVDEKYVRIFHPYAGNKNSHRSKTHQQQQQIGKQNIGKGLRNGGVGGREMIVYGNGYDVGYDHSGGLTHSGSNHGFGSSAYDPFDTPTGQKTGPDYFDTKFFETRKYRNLYNHNRKYRRYVDDASSSSGTGNINAGGPGGSGIGSRAHRAIVSSSQLSIEVSDLHASANGKLEITCLATIPAHVGIGEQFADYKTYSVKIDVEAVESTSVMPSMSGMAALGNASSAQKQHYLMPSILAVCEISIFIIIQLMKYDFRN